MTDDTDTGTELPVESLPLESVDRETARDSEHVLESTVEVFHEYEQRYDPEKDVILVGPTRTTDKEMNAFTEYNCTCGESFTDQSEAIEHLVETTGEQPES
jgi:hypothetical protein